MPTDPKEEDEIRPPTRQKMLEWIAALSAAGMDYRLSRHGSEWVLHVPCKQSEAARKEIQAYEDTNANWPPGATRESMAQTTRYHTWAAVWGVLFLIWFYVWLGPYDPGNAVLRAGSADVARIASGEWWRMITALTLHSGVVHLAGNAMCLLFLGYAVCRVMGGGLGWLLILASGVAGNMAVALLTKSDHVSVGASTACFGALGIISVYQSVKSLRCFGEWRSVWSRTWVPLCAGLALLGFMGTSPGSNLAAHGFGFVFGVVIALPFSWCGTEGLPEWAQRALELTCIIAVMFSWCAAFRSIV